ncbi:MAG: hypothetical protein U9R31_01620, partial [Candidatus Omnitrophota bacterium]|nr:hypothetical protein [Candidatus Omnitrophota bacterium]
PLGEILVELGHIDKERLELALVKQFGSKLGEILIENKLVTIEKLRKAFEKQSQFNKPLGEILISLNYISEESFLNALSIKYDMPFVNLAEYKINIEAINKVPITLCKECNILPIDIKDGCLTIATATPEDVITEQNIKVITGMEVKIVIALGSEIKKRITS